jgi:3-oxoacyl-[acyl-carrier protein] reductase
MAVILIAGGAAGVGGACFRRFSADGDTPVIVDSNEPALATLADGCDPGQCLRHDLLDPATPALAVEATVRTFGRIDGLFVNLNQATALPLSEWTPELWNSDLAVNLRVPFFFAQAAAPHLARSGGGSIVFTSSTAALRGGGTKAPFHSAKAGLLGLARSLADELAPDNIRVNCILPGWIDSPFGMSRRESDPQAGAMLATALRTIPAGRFGTVDEVAGAVAFLLSNASRYITGTSIVIDGGHTAI